MKRHSMLSMTGVMILLLCGGGWVSSSTVVSMTAFQSIESQPLYRFRSKKGHLFYTPSATVPKASDGPWKNEGIVCYVPLKPNHTINTTSVFQLAKSDNWGARFAYTNSFAEADGYKGGPANENGVGQWFNQGEVFRVCSQQGLNTVPLYRLYLPVRLTNPGQKFTGVVVGTDTQFLTTSESEKNNALSHGWVDQGIIGYVWLSPYPPPPTPLPDLTVFSAKADESSVTVILMNKGKANTGGFKYDVRLTVFDESGKVLIKSSKAAPGMSPNQKTQVVFDQLGKSLNNTRYKVSVDSTNALEESDEGNNETGMLEGPHRNLISPKVNPDAVRPPSISLSGQRDVTMKNGAVMTVFTLSVYNWESYSKEWFQELTVLPETSCAAEPTKARMLAHIWIQTGERPAQKAGCKPLNSQLELKTVETMPTGGALPKPDRIFVVLEDRLVGASYKSDSVVVGAFNIDKTLFPLGCKRFLGRATDFVCTKKLGFDACENLKKQGKPINCRLAGNGASK